MVLHTVGKMCTLYLRQEGRFIKSEQQHHWDKQRPASGLYKSNRNANTDYPTIKQRAHTSDDQIVSLIDLRRSISAYLSTVKTTPMPPDNTCHCKAECCVLVLLLLLLLLLGAY